MFTVLHTRLLRELTLPPIPPFAPVSGEQVTPRGMEPSPGGSFDALLGVFSMAERTTSELIESLGSDVTRCHKSLIDSIDDGILCLRGFPMLKAVTGADRGCNDRLSK